jgi:hypothetical protein
MQSPVGDNVTVVSAFGPRWFPFPDSVFHDGADVRAVYVPVKAVADGAIVEVVKNNPTAGNYVVIEHKPGHFTYYLHLSSIAVSPRDAKKKGSGAIKAGDIIGISGETGSAKGNPHLHLGYLVRGEAGDQWRDPMPCLGYRERLVLSESEVELAPGRSLDLSAYVGDAAGARIANRSIFWRALDTNATVRYRAGASRDEKAATVVAAEEEEVTARIEVQSGLNTRDTVVVTISKPGVTLTLTGPLMANGAWNTTITNGVRVTSTLCTVPLTLTASGTGTARLVSWSWTDTFNLPPGSGFGSNDAFLNIFGAVEVAASESRTISLTTGWTYPSNASAADPGRISGTYNYVLGYESDGVSREARYSLTCVPQ